MGTLCSKRLNNSRWREGKLDGVANGLDSGGLAADGGPRNFGDGFEGALDAFADADDFEGDALIGVETDFHAGLELFLGEQGGAENDGGNQAGFPGRWRTRAAGEQFIDANEGGRCDQSRGLARRRRLR